LSDKEKRFVNVLHGSGCLLWFEMVRPSSSQAVCWGRGWQQDVIRFSARGRRMRTACWCEPDATVRALVRLPGESSQWRFEPKCTKSVGDGKQIFCARSDRRE